MTDVDPEEPGPRRRGQSDVRVAPAIVGRKALTKAMDVLDNMNVADIPIEVAVRLLKFGADLERKAVLGIEPDGDDDLFSQLAGSLER